MERCWGDSGPAVEATGGVFGAGTEIRTRDSSLARTRFGRCSYARMLVPPLRVELSCPEGKWVTATLANRSDIVGMYGSSARIRTSVT